MIIFEKGGKYRYRIAVTGFKVVSKERIKCLRMGFAENVCSLNTKTDLTHHSYLVLFEDVDVILQLNDLFLYFLKDSLHLIVTTFI